MKYKNLLLLLFMLPILSGCNDTDDVAKIFTGKTWKLTYITEKNKNHPYNFWGDPIILQKAQNQINSGGYLLNFSGSETQNVINGAVSGQLKAVNISGSWSANGESRDFQCNATGSENDEFGIGSRFMYGLNNATSYSGDSENLYLYYKEKSTDKTLCLVFHAL